MNLIGRVVRAIAAALESCRRGHHWGGGTVPTSGHALAGVGYSASFVGTASHSGRATAYTGFVASTTGFQNEIHIGRATAYSGLGASLVGTAAENDIHVGLATAGVGFRGSILGTKIDARPSAPVLQGTAGNARTDLSWTIPNGNGAPVTGYLLIRNLFQGSQTTVYDGPLTSYTDFAVTNDTEYTYTVVAYNAIGNNSVGSNVVPLTPNTGVPATPVLAGTSGDSVANLTWAAPASQSALQPYTLKRNGVTLTPAPAANATSYQNAGLNNNTQYTYQLIANNLSGPSQPSNSVPLTPIAGGAPVLPANQAIGRAAAGMIFWSAGAGLADASPALYQTWKSNLGFTGYVAGQGGGYMHGYNGSQRLRGSSALAFTSDSSYDYMRACEGAAVGTTNVGSDAGDGPYQAKLQDPTLVIFHKVKLHKPPPTVSSPASDYLGPYGGDWWDNTHWADVCSRAGTMAAGLKFLGGDGIHTDPEFGYWEAGPTGGHTVTEQYTQIEKRGFEFGTALWTNFPNLVQGWYGTVPKGSWHDEVNVNNTSPGHGVYDGYSTSDPANVPPLDENIRHLQFYFGMWRAAAALAGPLAKVYRVDAFFYHAAVQYGGVTGGVEFALRWNLWGTLSWLTRNVPVGVSAASWKTTLNWLLPRFFITPSSWGGTDNNNGYYTSQLGEPAFTDLLNSCRKWGMGGLRFEYFLGSDDSGFSARAGTPDSAQSGALGTSNSSRQTAVKGYPVGGPAWGRNFYTGAPGVVQVAHTGTDVNGVVRTFGPTSPTIQSGPAWATDTIPPYNPATTSRAARMRAAGSTASIGTTWPTVTGPNGTGNPTAVRTANTTNVTITCRVTHAHSPWYVAVYRGTNFNRNNPAPNFLGVMTMTFEPNNGTNRPPAGLASPYMSCTFATTGTAGEYYVLKAVSTKEDERWLNVQSN